MAVYTKVAEDELRAFLEGYDLGELVGYDGIAEGVENSNYLLRTQTGRSILTLFEKRVRAEDLPFFMAFKDHLCSRGIECPAPIHRRDGGIIGTLAGRPAVIVSFLDGRSVEIVEPHHCASFGRTLGQMHREAEGFTQTRRNSLSVNDWRPLFEKVGDRADTLEAGLAEEIRVTLDRLEARWPKDLPTGVVHADAFPDNVFFAGGAVSGVIDFYFACTEAYAYDLAIAINAWCFDASGRFDRDRSAALLSAYEEVRPLTKREADALPLLCEGAAMRFFVTRLFDDLNRAEDAVVTVKDPSQPLRWLRHHRSTRTAADYGRAGIDA